MSSDDTKQETPPMPPMKFGAPRLTGRPAAYQKPKARKVKIKKTARKRRR